jgi:hypothetical protein
MGIVPGKDGYLSGRSDLPECVLSAGGANKQKSGKEEEKGDKAKRSSAGTMSFSDWSFHLTAAALLRRKIRALYLFFVFMHTDVCPDAV